VHKDLQSCALKTPSENPRLAAHSLDRGTEFGPQLRQAAAAQVAPLDPLEVGPEAFAWIQRWGIGREALQVEARGGSIDQQLSDDMAAVNGGAIPEHAHPTGHLAPPGLADGHHSHRIDGAVLAVGIPFRLRGDGPDGREMSAGPPVLQDRGVPPGRRGADDPGQRIEARFVYAQEALPFRWRPLWLAGRVSWRQRAIATSSRWRARRAGFCRLHCRAVHKRPTGTGW
jgi:hypothetical protein